VRHERCALGIARVVVKAVDHVGREAATVREDEANVGIARRGAAEDQAADRARRVGGEFDDRLGHHGRDRVHATRRIGWMGDIADIPRFFRDDAVERWGPPRA
jgi:hypothetical protein